MKNSQEVKQESLTNEEIISDTPSIVSGSIFLLGDHILLCSDSRDTKNIEKLLQGREIQLLLTDPPY